MTVLVVVGVVGIVAAAGAWSARVLTDPDRYVAAVAPLCGDRRTSAIAAFVLRRRLQRIVGRPAAARLHPLLSRMIAAGSRSPVAVAGWRTANRALHRHRRVVRLGRLPRIANSPLLVLTAAAGRLAAITSADSTSRDTAAR